jgi:hypothetical protein
MVSSKILGKNNRIKKWAFEEWKKIKRKIIEIEVSIEFKAWNKVKDVIITTTDLTKLSNSILTKKMMIK